MSSINSDGASFLEKMVARPRPVWAMLGVAVFLLALPFIGAYLDGQLTELLRSGYWRPLLVAPVVILYILIVSPILAQSDVRVLSAFRPIVMLDDAKFAEVVRRAGRTKPAYEFLVLGGGVLFGAWLGARDVEQIQLNWTFVITTSLNCLMFGLLALVIYWSILGTRVISALHRQSLRFDLFDLTPFEPIGRQSLVLALTFVGGITLSLAFVLALQNLFSWQNLLTYALLALVPLVVFFLNMRDTHQTLAQTKARELENVERLFVRAARELQQRVGAAENADGLSAQVTALAQYREFVRNARTWPYDTAALRTLFVSLLIPAGAAVAKQVFE